MAHPGVGKVTFTGGTEPGRSVAVARRFAHATVELGGKSPILVFADSPLDDCVPETAFGGFIGAGQTCVAGTRLLIERSVYHEVVAGLAAQAEAIRIGDPASPDTQLGR